MSEILIIVLLIIAGGISGFINTLAGSGSFITLPLLIFLGLPANIANGTNRIGIFFQNLVGVITFGKQKILNFNYGIKLSIPAFLGSLIGAIAAVKINTEIFEKIIGIIMLIMLIPLLIDTKKWLRHSPTHTNSKISIFQILLMFFIGAYSGFIQAGVGIFLALSLIIGCGFDVLQANALKVFIILITTFLAVIIFIINKQINYYYAFALTIGNIIGAYIAAKIAIKKGISFIKWFLIIIIVLSGIKLLFL